MEMTCPHCGKDLQMVAMPVPPKNAAEAMIKAHKEEGKAQDAMMTAKEKMKKPPKEIPQIK